MPNDPATSQTPTPHNVSPRARILKTLCATVQTFMSNPDPALAAAAAAINAELSSAFAAEISPPPAAPPAMAH